MPLPAGQLVLIDEFSWNPLPGIGGAASRRDAR